MLISEIDLIDQLSILIYIQISISFSLNHIDSISISQFLLFYFNQIFLLQLSSSLLIIHNDFLFSILSHLITLIITDRNFKRQSMYCFVEIIIDYFLLILNSTILIFSYHFLI